MLALKGKHFANPPMTGAKIALPVGIGCVGARQPFGDRKAGAEGGKSAREVALSAQEITPGRLSRLAARSFDQANASRVSRRP